MIRSAARAAALALALAAFGGASTGELPAPAEFFGFPIGAEGKLARWDRIVEYCRRVAAGSDRVRFEELGKSTSGNPFVMLVISSPENLRDIERYRAINRRLFDPRTLSSEVDEEQRLISEARIFVLVTCSIHATEVGATQMAVEAIHRLATESSPQVRNILDNVVFLLVPSFNPDGQILVTDWYNKTRGTPHENAPLPCLYHPYTGHDNNRDAYMFTQQETRLLGRVLYHDWLPAVWLDEHQMGSTGPRIFVMPAMDPINPNVDPVIYRNAGLLGFAQAAALERAGKHGIVYGDIYTYWWEGAMAWAGWWHNMIGMLTEVASARIATTVEQERAEPGRRIAPQPGRGGRVEDTGKPLAAQWELLGVNDLGEEIRATPALSDGRIYVRTRGSLYCFGTK